MADYEVLDWGVANEMKKRSSTHFMEQLEYNLASIYQMEDSTYLVMPLNPFAKSLRTKDRNKIDQWIEQSYFPTDEMENKFYFDNKECIDNINGCKEQMKEELLKYVYKDGSIPKEVEAEDIDRIYKVLRSRKRFKEYQLHFILLAGDYLIAQNTDIHCRWGLLRSKQLLNPVVSIVLVKDTGDEKEYFKIQKGISGKWGYQGMMSLSLGIKQFWNRPDGIVEVISSWDIDLLSFSF